MEERHAVAQIQVHAEEVPCLAPHEPLAAPEAAVPFQAAHVQAAALAPQEDLVAAAPEGLLPAAPPAAVYEWVHSCTCWM